MGFRRRRRKNGCGIAALILFLAFLPLLFWNRLLSGDTHDITFCSVSLILAGLTYVGIGYAASQVVL